MSVNQSVKKIMDAIPKTSLSPPHMYGTVTTTSPLSVSIDNRLTIPQQFLKLSVLCRQTSLWRGLQSGDKVIMLNDPNGKNYYVMERVGMVIQ